ncbi:hypothetical protein Tco_0394532 [Tanacetum coccineum]
MSLVNQYLFYFKNGNSEARKYVTSLHKIHAYPFPEDDLEELNTRWYFHKNDIEDMYIMCINGKIKDYRQTGLLKSLILFIRSCVYWERVQDYQMGKESYQQKINLTTPTITFPGIEKEKLLTITSDHVVGLIYENSKQEKRVMNITEILKFCDATLKRVLEKVNKLNFDVKHGSADPNLNNEDAEYMMFYEEYIQDRLRHHDQMRCWESYVNGRPL